MTGPTDRELGAYKGQGKASAAPRHRAQYRRQFTGDHMDLHHMRATDEHQFHRFVSTPASSAGTGGGSHRAICFSPDEPMLEFVSRP
jgi:hypothetical protein